MADARALPHWPEELLNDPTVRSPLGPLAGAAPPAPRWFGEALAVQPERSRVPVDGAEIEMLTWGEVGRPGLLFLHGNGAHADWWSFIAPFFASEWRVAAMSWSGMGGSDWRNTYSVAGYVREALAVSDAAGLAASGRPPAMVGHSFGGAPLMLLTTQAPERVGEVMIVDSYLPRPGDYYKRREVPEGPLRAYPTPEAALARFRFMPPQTCENLFIADHIARRALRETPEGWTWKHDPKLWSTLDRSGVEGVYTRLPRAVVSINGDRSLTVPRSRVRELRTQLPAGSRFVEVPDCAHHIMVDQPIALVSALRAVLQH